jgi:RNA polymerase sigma factor (sigma-70 family)
VLDVISSRPPERLSAQQRRLVEEHVVLAARAVSALRRRLPTHADPDNLSGEALLALVQAARRWKGQGSFGAYAAVCIRNALQDAMATAARATWLPLEWSHEPIDADTASHAVALADYRSAREQLTPVEQQTITLAAVGFGPSEQAALLRLPVNTVKQRLWRARRRLVPQLAA